MALTPCRECGLQVSTEAATCPHCGIALPAEAGDLVHLKPVNEFTDSQRQKPRRKLRIPFWLGWLAVVLFVFWFLGGFIWVMQLAGVDTDTMLGGGIPKCNSKTATSLAKQAIEQSPLAKVINISVFEVQDATEIAYDSQLQKRTCKATAFTNSGKHDLQYSLEWADQGKGTIWLQIDNIN
jgi:hypothetical protein